MYLHILSILETRAWYRNSTNEIKGQLHDLAESDYVGFVEYLASFPDYFAGTDIVRLQRIVRASYSLVVPIFEVRKGDKVFTYEFASWKMGPRSGSKGILFVRKGGKITHFIVLRSHKFALAGQEIYDSFGGFAERGETALADTFRREVQEEFGADIEVDVVGLGALYSDPGMTNNHIGLFVGFVELCAVSEHGSNYDSCEMKSTASMFPIGQLDDFILNYCDDSVVLATVARARAKKLI